jgi:cytochrome P450
MFFLISPARPLHLHTTQPYPSSKKRQLTSPPPSIAGSDTVATSLRAAILYIASDASIVQRIRAELAAAGVSPTRPTTSILSYADARNIRYLVAVVREVLRIHPPAIATMEKQLGPEDDVLPDGRVIPARTIIALSLTAILRDPETWGDDAEVFRPERWLEDVGEERKRGMDRAHELIFGSGRFICLGREIAMMHIVKVVAEVCFFSFFSFFSFLFFVSVSVLRRRFGS